MDRVLLTGGAGFIGSHLADRLVQRSRVTVVDNLSTGRLEHVNSAAEFVKGDLLHDDLAEYFTDKDTVFHMAANPEVRMGTSDTRVHLDQNVMVTYNVLEAMRKKGVKKLVFVSTSTVYGEAETPTPENYGPLLPISLYGASKLACEALVSSYCSLFDIQAWIFRLANVIGPRSSHGVIFDFVDKLRANPEELEILGDGNQRKSYIHVQDCLDGILCGMREQARISVFNLGSEDQTPVKRIAQIVSEEMKLAPVFRFTGGDRGWRGDVPVMLLSVKKIQQLGWRLRYKSEEAVRVTARFLVESGAA